MESRREHDLSSNQSITQEQLQGASLATPERWIDQRLTSQIGQAGRHHSWSRQIGSLQRRRRSRTTGTASSHSTTLVLRFELRILRIELRTRSSSLDSSWRGWSFGSEPDEQSCSRDRQRPSSGLLFRSGPERPRRWISSKRQSGRYENSVRPPSGGSSRRQFHAPCSPCYC